MLDQLTRSTFAENVGSVFRMQIDESRSVEVRLIEATSLASIGPNRPGSQREPFSLVFRAPPGIQGPQRIYRLAHDKLPVMELFLVPIGPDEQGMRYQAIFT